MEMSEAIKYYRKNAGMTQEELAEKIGLQKSAIAKYENGRVENLKRSVLTRMAEVLNCPPAALLGFPCEENKEYICEMKHLCDISIMEKYLKLDERDRERIEERIDTMLESDKYKK